MSGGKCRASVFSVTLLGMSLVLAHAVPSWATVWTSVYNTDFSSDPGWTVNDPSKLGWDPAGGTFRIYKETAVGYKNIADIVPSFDPTQPWRLELDSVIDAGVWSAGMTFGLFDSRVLLPYGVAFDQTLIGANNNPTTLWGPTWSGDWTNSSGVWTYSPSWSLHVWYHHELEYNPASGELSLNVTDMSSGLLLLNLSVAVSPFRSDMTYLGFSREHVATWPAQTVDYKLDNVALFSGSDAAVPEPLTILGLTLSMGSIGLYVRKRRGNTHF